jgi:hypothetical protein
MPPRKKAAADAPTAAEGAEVAGDANVTAKALIACIAEYEGSQGAARNKENDNEVLAKISKKIGKGSGPEDYSLLGLGFKSLAVMHFNQKSFARAAELFGRGMEAFTRCDMGLKVHVCMHLRAKSITSQASDPARTDQEQQKYLLAAIELLKGAYRWVSTQKIDKKKEPKSAKEMTELGASIEVRHDCVCCMCRCAWWCAECVCCVCCVRVLRVLHVCICVCMSLHTFTRLSF